MTAGGWRGARRVLAVRMDNIGDVVLLGPALRALRAALPQAELTLLASPTGAQAAPLLPWVDDVVVHRAVWQETQGRRGGDPGADLELAAGLRARRFDAAFVFTSFSQSPWPPAYLCHLAGVPYRVGQARDFGGALLTDAAPPAPYEEHNAQRNLHLLRGVGVPVPDGSLEVRVPAEAVESAGRLLAAEGVHPDDGYVVVAPGASCEARLYDPGRLGRAVRALVDRGLPVVVVGSERESATCRPAVEAGGRPLVGRTDVPGLAAVIAGARLVVCNNSGPLHLADALRRPVVCLYSGAEPLEHWSPRSSPARLLRRPTACTPCHGFDCPYDVDCLDVPPEEVVEACLDLLDAGIPEVLTA